MSAERKIKRGAVEWFDFCASIGQIPANVGHMQSIKLAFAEWLQKGGA